MLTTESVHGLFGPKWGMYRMEPGILSGKRATGGGISLATQAHDLTERERKRRWSMKRPGRNEAICMFFSWPLCNVSGEGRKRVEKDESTMVRDTASTHCTAVAYGAMQASGRCKGWEMHVERPPGAEQQICDTWAMGQACSLPK